MRTKCDKVYSVIGKSFAVNRRAQVSTFKGLVEFYNAITMI